MLVCVGRSLAFCMNNNQRRYFYYMERIIKVLPLRGDCDRRGGCSRSRFYVSRLQPLLRSFVGVAPHTQTPPTLRV